ncbi:MAG: pilus assembly PilX N-terminal domain-containing protein [Candidatus Sumerlaeia bacterium]|nr:pilus assembly PilX N-terminal domain-containing protein [Candidatus Sumerlaeia bacterium]
MRKHRQESRTLRKKLRGSILLTSVVLMTVAGIGTTAWLSYVTQSARGSAQDRARTNALYAAEAGVEAVVDFFNNPSRFQGTEPNSYEYGEQPSNYPLAHPNVAPDWYGLFEPYIVSYAFDADNEPLYNNGRLVTNRTTHFRNLAAGNNEAVSRTSKVPTAVLDLTENPERIFYDEEGREISRIHRIALIHPNDANIPWNLVPNNFRIITVVEATGRTPDGVEETISSIITENTTFEISSPGPIISRASAGYNGNFNVYWGEKWVASDVELENNFTNKFPRSHEDPWFRFRTEGVFMNHNGNRYADGRVRGGFGNNAVAPGTPVYEVPFHTDYLEDRNQGTGNNGFTGFDNLLQNQDIDFPEFDYNDWKTFVQQNGFRYYFTDTSGNIYGTERDPGSGNFGQIVSKSYADWFGTSPTDSNYDNVSEKVVFIDSVPVDDNGNTGPRDENNIPIINDTYYPRNPAINGGDPAARTATISIAGGGLHTRGAMFIAADMSLAGQGNPPSSTQVPNVKKPDGSSPDSSFRIAHNGFKYIWGEFNSSGNRTVYGSLYTERGYHSSGTPEVYYNVEMQDGSWLNLNVSRVRRIMWNFSDYTRFTEEG